MKSVMDRLTEDVGGVNNAFTTDDNTVYFEVVPSNYLETLLWAEGDRMSGLNVDEANFKSERAVVEEEYRQSIATPPYGRFEYLLRQKSFQQHPYKRPTIGSLEDLEAASLADVQDFHRTYYRPDNATLIVVGDFDQKQIDSWIDKYLGSVPRPPTPLPRDAFKEAGRKSESRFTEYVSNVPLRDRHYLSDSFANKQ
jgi:zinc protease